MMPTNATVLRSRFRSQRIAQFTESVIREMTRLAVRHGAINLAQGFPDFPAPAVLKSAAVQAIDADINQYAITWGAKPFRDAIAAKYQRTYGMEFDPEREITVCCGATEGIIASLLAVLDPGDEVRSILVNSMSKTYSVTGWRVGWGARLARPDRLDPKNSRLSYGGGRRSAAAGRRACFRFRTARKILHPALAGVCRAPRPPPHQPARCWF
jgi:aminotransferase